MGIPGGHFVSKCCTGVKCRCGEPASHKVEEVIFDDEPPQSIPVTVPSGRVWRQQRHPFTAYVCCKCFRAIMGPAVACEVVERQIDEATIVHDHEMGQWRGRYTDGTPACGPLGPSSGHSAPSED